MAIEVECPKCGCQMVVEPEDEPGVPDDVRAAQPVSAPKRARPKTMDRARKKAEKFSGVSTEDAEGLIVKKPLLRTPMFWVFAFIGLAVLIAGPVIGASVLVFLKEWLRFLREYYMIIYGAGIILMMIFMPYGIMGLVKRVSARFQD